LLSIGSLITMVVLGRFLDKSPRKMFDRYVKLTGQGWGSLYPRLGNIVIICEFLSQLFYPL